MSKQKLIIVESPAKCNKIEKILGKGYKVIASYGHFTKLDDLAQINFDTFEIEYKVDNKKNLKIMRDFIKKSDDVIIATDDDREGEAIGWTICKFCKLNPKTTKKISFQEITKTALTKSLNNVGILNMSRIKSQQTRQILDIYLGYKISPMLWKFIKHKLSAGRCQTPALKLIYDNEKKIESTPNETDYRISASFTGKRIMFSLTENIEKSNIDDFVNNIKEKLDNGNTWSIQSTQSRNFSEAPPQVLITSTLQQKAYNLMKMSTKNTMKCAQELYENGLITYMRTDSSCYAKEFVEDLTKHIDITFGEKYIHENINHLSKNKNKGKSQEAHEGIRVCDLGVTEAKLQNTTANKLYNFIYKHTIQCGMSNCIGKNHDYIIKCDDHKTFKYTDRQVVFDGWKRLENIKSTVSHKSYLDELYARQRTFPMNFMECTEKLVHSICHLNEASLVQQLEKMNIGRPSTFSNIVQGLQDRKYVKKENVEGKKSLIKNYLVEPNKDIAQEEIEKSLNSEKSKMIITPIGKQVVEFCYDHFEEIFDFDFTNNMEKLLDDIENNETYHHDVLNKYIKNVNKLIEGTNKNFEDNPETIKKVKDVSLHCGSINGVVSFIKSGKYGYYLNHGKDKISLKDFNGFDISQKINLSSSLTLDEQNTLSNYLDTRTNNRQSNILVTLSSDCSVRKSKHGIYIYYKTKNMKQPKFMAYNNENDDKKDIREQWVTSQDQSSIKEYILQKYKLTI